MTAPQRDPRLAALRRFAAAITALNLLGYTVLGFEQAWIAPLAALLTAYTLELGFEALQAAGAGRRPRFHGGRRQVVDFLLPAHITGLAVTMLLYANARIWPIVFAVTVAITSKVLFRAPVGAGRTRHVLNPSNTGIAVTLLLFPWVSIAPPYHFTEGIDGWLDWALPGLIIVTGTMLNGRLTGRLPLIGAWLAGFVTQAGARSLVFGTPLVAGLLPMTGVAFILFTNYMITDPATTPTTRQGQVAFGAATSLAYGLLMVFHVVFGLFFALVIVCLARSGVLYAADRAHRRVQVPEPIGVSTGLQGADA